MSDKVKYILYSVCDFGFTFGGTAAVIIYNYVSAENTLGFKISFTGIVLGKSGIREKLPSQIRQLIATARGGDKRRGQVGIE